MPGVVPSAQGRRRQPGAVGAVAPRPALAGSDTAPHVPGDQGQDAAAAGRAGQEDAPFAVGQDVEVTIEDVAQGGWCVARPAGQPVMFVRHALPGERVVAHVTEVTAKFARADAVEILRESQDRVKPPCPHARPGGCGGCDWQHAALPAQRSLKAAVVAQQLRRLAGIDREVTVEPLPGDAAPATGGTPGLGWRTRVQFAVDRDGVAGLRGHRSHQVIDIGDCLIAHQGVRDLDVPGDDWSGAAAVEAAVGGADSTENFAVTVIEDAGRKQKPNTKNRKSRPNGSGRLPNARRTLVEGRAYLAERAAGRLWQVSADGFWQVHPAAADTLSQAVVAALDPKPGDTVLDLYCGAGLFAGAVAPLVGAEGAVTGVEFDSAAVKNARQNLSDYPWVKFERSDVARAVSEGSLPPARLVIADPPRAGLAREAVDYLIAARVAAQTPAERFAYVSCDPATLARDLALLTGGGWTLENLRAFDAFPMTHHVECVATLTRTARRGLRRVGLARGALRVRRPWVAWLADHVVAQAGVADQQAFLDQHAEGLGAGLPGVAVVLAERRDRRGGGACRILPGHDRLAQNRGELHVRPWV
jgi:tRNA/tmRNA/rRNA uracil-C5-methylase (TrmA/RlmC/RlmD family)